jgi:predicted transcriptional regulator
MRARRREGVVSMRLKSGADLKVLIADLGVTQRQLASSAGVHETFIHALIAGTRGCRAETALVIVDALHKLGAPRVTVDMLFITRVHPGPVAIPAGSRSSATVGKVA